MSRIASQPVPVPAGVELVLEASLCRAKGSKGSNSMPLHESVQIVRDGDMLRVQQRTAGRHAREMAGTMRALLANLVRGVEEGFERQLEIHGVGYRARMQDNTLRLTLGFSHPVEFPVPAGITITTPSQTVVVVAGCDRQKVGQVAAEIRMLRPPEPYGGKGVRYKDENILRKEVKKK